MPVTTADKRDTFRKMHESGCFILPNPWDVGSARALQQLGFKALASTSAGFAWSIGKADNRVTLEDALRHLTELCGAVDLPVNADFEGGFAHKPDKVGVNVARAVKTGVAGLSIEDFDRRCRQAPLYERGLRDRAHQGGAGGDRCRQQRRSADGPLRGLSGRAGRSRHGDRPAQGLFGSRRGLPLRAWHQDQGADSAIVKAVHPKPVNLLIGASGLSRKRGRRSRRSPHQRRRLAGANGMGRLHAFGAGDGREGDVHRTRPRAIPAAN